MLEGMKILAHTIDSHHWERLREKSRAGKNKSNDKSNKGNKTDDKNKNSKGKNKADNSNKSAKTPSSSGNPNLLADKLGKDGKLTQQERQRRFNNNLCMFCGGVGHTAKDCPKSSSSASKAKARAAQAKEKVSAKTGSKKKTKQSSEPCTC